MCNSIGLVMLGFYSCLGLQRFLHKPVDSSGQIRDGTVGFLGLGSVFLKDSPTSIFCVSQRKFVDIEANEYNIFIFWSEINLTLTKLKLNKINS